MAERQIAEIVLATLLELLATLNFEGCSTIEQQIIDHVTLVEVELADTKGGM